MASNLRAIQMKLAPCLKTISSAKRIRATKISALFTIVCKEDMLHTTKASEGEARASKSEVPVKPIKFLIPFL